MSARATLIALCGGSPVASGLLGACRLESGNVDAFGIEAVSDSFRRAPLPGAATATIVEATGQLALFGESEAVFADLFADNIGRLWRVGQVEPGTPEPAVGVAFDTDLQQARGAVFVSAADHPALAHEALDRITTLGHALVHDATPGFAAFRARAFAVRAFGDGDRGSVLFAVHALAPNPSRVPQLRLAAARWDGATTQVVRDPAVVRAEHVRIVS